MSASNRPLAIVIGLITSILVGWVLYVGAGILQPLVIALLLASMLQPVVRGLARFHIPPTLTVVALASLLFFGIMRLGILVESNISAFVRGAQGSAMIQGPPIPVEILGPDGAPLEGEALVEALNRDALDPLVPANTTPRSTGWPDIVAKFEAKLRENERLPDTVVRAFIKWLSELDLAGFVADALGSGIDFMRALFLVVLYMVFIFAEQAVFRRKILAVAGDRRRDAAQVLDTIARGIQRYLGVKTVASVTTGALCYLGLVLLEVPYALLFGVVTALMNYIPTFGSIIASVFPMATAFAVADGNNSIGTVIIVGVLYLSVNTLIGSFLEPKVLGRELNLSPLVIIVSVVVWAGLWGVVGAFLAVPIMATLQIVLNSTYTTRPIAVLLSSGPPKEERKLRVRVRRRQAS